MVTLSSVSPDVPIAPVSVARSSLAFSFNRNVLVLVLVVLCLGSCGISTLHPPEPSSLSAEIAALRASTVRFRASHFGPTNSMGSNHEVGNGDTEATTVNPESLDGTVFPGKRTVEEHDRWPAVLNSDSSANLSSDTLFPENELISLNAVDLPLNVLLHSLADEVDLQLSMQGSHTQSVTLRVVETSLAEILEILFQQASFRWQIIGRQLRILPDLPFLKTYPISYLNLTRRMQGSVGLATQVGSINLNQESGSSSGFSNSSQSLIENEAHHAFWESLVDGLSSLFGSRDDPSTMISVNRDASLVTVRAKQKQHVEIKHYLEEVEKSTRRQVLIEATVVEVNLSDRFSAGIDWRMLGDGSTSVNAAQVFHGKPEVQAGSLNKLPTPTALLSAIHQSNSLGKITATLNLLNQFGDVKILSRPQIIAINNQSAVLKVVDNRVYFTMKVERQSRDGEDELTTETEIHTVPVGLVMSVTPFVGEDDSVVLNVRPTISRILGFVNDPNPELAIAQVQNGVPEIQVREMESVLKVGSGQIAMIGGLMQEQQTSDRSGVPWLDQVPVLGSLFSHRKRRSGTTELLVFLQPTVLQDGKLSR